MAKLTFKTDNCKGCGLCVEACPKKILKLDTENLNEKGYSTVSSNVAQSTISLTQDFSDFVTEGLTARAAFSFDATNTNTLNRNISPKTFMAIGRGEPTEENPLGALQYDVVDNYAGYITLGKGYYGKRYINFEGSINYERQFAYAHRVSAMALYSMRDLTLTRIAISLSSTWVTTDLRTSPLATVSVSSLRLLLVI